MAKENELSGGGQRHGRGGAGEESAMGNICTSVNIKNF